MYELYISNPQGTGAIVGTWIIPNLKPHCCATSMTRTTSVRIANRACTRHTSRLRLSKLRAHLGGDFPVAKIRHRLKCDLCGSKTVVVTFPTPAQCTGSLVHLFDKKPKP
jgi:hypothetical protein